MAPILGIYASQQISGHLPSPSFASIATVTATGGETSLSFTSIPGTYKHLQVRGIAKDTYSTSLYVEAVYIQFNSDTANNYSAHQLYSYGGAVYAAAQATTNEILGYGGIVSSGTGGTNMFGSSIVDIIDYASTSKYKTIKAFAGGNTNVTTTTGGNAVGMFSGLWQNTAAITKVTLLPGQTAFAAGSTFALYGIKG